MLGIFGKKYDNIFVTEFKLAFVTLNKICQNTGFFFFLFCLIKSEPTIKYSKYGSETLVLAYFRQCASLKPFYSHKDYWLKDYEKLAIFHKLLTVMFLTSKLLFVYIALDCSIYVNKVYLIIVKFCRIKGILVIPDS